MPYYDPSGNSTVNRVETAVKPLATPPSAPADAIAPGKGDVRAPEGNLYSDGERERVRKQYGENWGKLSWFDQQRALAHDRWFSDLDSGNMDEDTLLDGIFGDPEVERINRREENFLHALRNAMAKDVSRLSDDEAQGYYMDLVEADPRFGFSDDTDGSKVFGAEAEYGRGNLSRLLGIYRGTNPDGLFSREAQRWLESNEAQKILMAKEGRGLKDRVFEMFDTDAEVVESHEKRLMAKERAVQFATLMGGLSPAGQRIVLESLRADEVDGRTLRFLDEDERESALAAFRCAKADLDANWWLTQGAYRFGDTAASVVKGTWRTLRNLYMTTGGRLPVGSRQLAAYEREQGLQLQIEDAERSKYKDLTFMGDVASGLIGTIPYMAAMTNPYTGTMAALGMANDARERMVLSGVDPDTALGISLPVGIVEGWIEKLQWEKAFGGSLSEFAIRRASMMGILRQIGRRKTEYIGGRLLKMGRETAVVTITEDCEEVLQQLAEDLGVALGKGEFNVREIAEDMWDTAVESFPTTLGFGLVRGSGLGPAMRRTFSRRSVAATDFIEYVQSRQAASNVIAQLETQGAEGKTADGKGKAEGSRTMENLLDDFRARWRGLASARGRVEMLCDSGLNPEQAAVVDEFFRLEDDFVADNPYFAYVLGESGMDFAIENLPSVMKGVKSVRRNPDGTAELTISLGGGETAEVKVERVSRGDLVSGGNAAAYEREVRDLYERTNPGRAWDDLDEDGKALFRKSSAQANGYTAITIDDATIPFDAVIRLAAADRRAGDRGAAVNDLGHEVFHAVEQIAKRRGILDAEAIARFRKVFGNPTIEGYDFDEEGAADAYGAFLMGRVPEDATVRRVFGAVRGFFRKVYNALARKDGNEPAELNRENIFQAIARGDLRGVSALSGIAVNEEADAKQAEGAKGESAEAVAKPEAAAPVERLDIPGVAEVEAEVAEVPAESLATTDDPDFDPQLKEAAPALVATEPADGVPVVAGGGNVLAGSGIVEKARKAGRKTVRVKRVRKVKTAKRPAGNAKGEKKGREPFDIFHAKESVARMNPFQRNAFLSVRRFLDVHDGAFPCLQFWLDSGRRMIARPRRSDRSARITDYLDLLSDSERIFLTGIGKVRGRGGVSWDGLPQAVGNGMEEMEPEAVLDRALEERGRYIEWKERGGLTPEEDFIVYQHDSFIAEGHTEEEWNAQYAGQAAAAAPEAAPPEDISDPYEDIETLMELEGEAYFSIGDTVRLLDDMAVDRLAFSRDGAAERARREYGEVVARYTNPDGTRKRGWMKAPNGKPTKLTERQWVQVRTPSFKRWFGDWEALATMAGWHNVADAKQFVDIVAQNVSEIEPLVGKAAFKEAFAKWGVVTNEADGRKVVFPNASAGKMERVGEVSGALKMLFEKSRLAWSEADDGRHPNIDGIHHYLAKAKTANGDVYVHFTVREDNREGNNVHSATVSSVDVYTKNAEITPGKDPAKSAPFTDNKIAYFLGGVNQASVSKVVDENGEPLVVYHGTPYEFSVFDRRRIKRNKRNMRGFFFTTNRDTSGYYGNETPCFLNVRHPLVETRGEEETIEAALKDGSIAQHDGTIAYAGENIKNNPYLNRGLTDDGIVEIVVPNPTQIKSATDNTGAFDPQDPDIRFSIARREDASWRSAVDDFIGGKMKPRSDATVLPRVPVVIARVLRENLGVDSDGRRIVVSSDCLKKAMQGKHRIPAEQMKKLAVSLDAPLAVFQSKTRPKDTVTALVPIRDLNGGISSVVPLDYTARASDGANVLRITSVYGKLSSEAVQSWIDQGYLLYADRKNISRSFPHRLQLPGRNKTANRFLDETDFSQEALGIVSNRADGRNGGQGPDVRFSVTVRRAMNDLAEEKDSTELENAKYGTITFPFGRLGKGGSGFLHIVEQRMAKDGASLDEAIDTAFRVGEAAERGVETNAKQNTRWLDYRGTRAIIALTEDGTPIITGYEISTDKSPVAYPTTDDHLSRPLVRKDEIVAALRKRLASQPTAPNIPQNGAEMQGGTRFSIRVNPRLREEVEAALNTDRAKGEVVKGGKRIVFCESPSLFGAIGIPRGTVYTKAYTLRKIAKEHALTAEQIASAPELLERPAAVFDDNGEGYIFLTDAIAPDRNGVSAPIMAYIRPDGSGNYIASAYSRTEAAEAKYVNLVNAGKVLYLDKDKVAQLPLRGEALSSLSTFSVGDNVATPKRVTARIVPQTGAAAQGGAADGRVPLLDGLAPRADGDEARFSVGPSGRDPADIIAGIVAANARRGRKMTVAEVQRMLASVGRDPGEGRDLLRRGQAASSMIGAKVRDRFIDDDTFLELATDEAKRSRMLGLLERSGEMGYRLGAEDERALAELGRAKEDAVLAAMASAQGFNAVAMELKYGFNIVSSVMNAKRHPTPKPPADGRDQARPGEVDGPGRPIDGTDGDEEAKKRKVSEVEAKESAALQSIKQKASKRADAIDAEYGLAGGESPAQKQAQADIDANGGEDGEAGGADGGEEPANGKAERKRIRRERLDFNRASDFLAFVEEVVAKELGVDVFGTPYQVRILANTAKFFLTRIARQLCYSHARELVMQDLDHLADQLSLRAVEASVMNAYARIQDRLIPEKQDELISRLEHQGRMIAEKGYSFSRGGDERERKVRAAVEEWWRMVKSYLRLDPKAVEEERDRLNGIIERRTEVSDREKAEGNPFAVEQDLRYQMAVDCLNALTQYGGLVNRTPGEIADKSEEILAQLRGSRAELENAREENRIRTRTISGRIGRAVLNPKAAASGKAPNPGWFTRMMDSMMGVLEVRMRDLIRYSHGEVRAEAEADLQDIEDAIALGSQTFNVLMGDAQNEFDGIMKRLYGSADRGIRRLTETLDDEDRRALAKQSSTDVITRSWLLQRYAELLQADDYAANIAIHKRDGVWRERFDEAFRKYIDDADMAFLVWMRNWYRKNLADLNEKVLVPVSGIRQYSPGENYFPVRMRQRTRQGPDAQAKAWSPLPSWLTPRVGNDLDFDERTDLITMWHSRMRESAASIAYAKLGLNLSDILLNPRFKETVADNHGEVALRRLVEHVTDIISGGGRALAESDDSIALADRLRAWQTNLTLSCNYVSALKQMVSCPVFALRHDIDFGLVWRCMTDVDYGSVRKLMASDGWKARYDSGLSEAMQNAMRVNSGSGSAATGLLHRLYNSGFAVMEFGDMVPCVWVGQGLFRHFVARIRDREGGTATMTEEEIERKALTRTWAVIEMTQQSKRTENLTAIQRGGNGMGRFLYQFMSSPVQQLAYEVQAVREALAARGTPHAAEANRHLFRVLVVNHVLMTQFLYLASVAAGLPLGKIPDRDSLFWDAFLETLLGQYGCIFIAGAVAEGTLDGLLRGKFDYRSDGLPVNGIIDLFRQLGVDAHDLLTWNNDEFAKDAIRTLKLLGAPVRHAVTAYENWGTEKGRRKRRRNLESWAK